MAAEALRRDKLCLTHIKEQGSDVNDALEHRSLLRMSSYYYQYTVMGKGKVLPVHGIKVDRMSGGIAPLILNLVDRWRRVVSFTHTGYLRSGSNADTQCIGGCAGPGIGLEVFWRLSSCTVSRFEDGVIQP